ncbi:LOW QUALITY PROTEIN: hypothetical protein JCM19038_328 [Geomicrobium sp. JCM 19038]|nr:LOW QUALITY PROTEIN: hypothetical protein JCM19038_328 [Geomicrobium sp. JCM 19038]
MNVLALLSLASAPALALLTYFYLRNDYGSANWKNIIRSFVTGMLIVFPIMAIQFALTEEGVFTSRLSDVFVKTAFIEEFFKWFFLLVTMYRFKTWSVKYDGIVYSVALSLGFATLENFFYLLSEGVHTAFGRALFPVSGHALFGVIMGYYLGNARYMIDGKKKKMVSLRIACPYFLHGTFNLMLTYTQDWMVGIIILFMIFLWWLGLSKVKKANENSKYV